MSSGDFLFFVILVEMVIIAVGSVFWPWWFSRKDRR